MAYSYSSFKDLLKFILRELREELGGEKNLQNNGGLLVGLGIITINPVDCVAYNPHKFVAVLEAGEYEIKALAGI